VLSKDWTAGRLFDEAVANLDIEDNWNLYLDRFSFCNRALQDVLEQIFPVVAPAYLTSDPISFSSTAKRSTSSTGTWTAATRTLVFAGMSADFDSGDLGKLVTIRIVNAIYLGTIETITDGETVVVRGFVLPAANATVDEVQVLGTALTGSTVDISSLRIMRSAQARITLESTVLDKPVPASTVDELLAWRSDDIGTPSIIFALEGSTLRIRTRLASVGSLSIHYHKMPEEMTDDASGVDVPDGAAVALVQARLKKLLATEAGIQLPDYAEEIKQHITTLADAFKAVVTTEQLKTKVSALV
jgi:hypothetical protein